MQLLVAMDPKSRGARGGRERKLRLGFVPLVDAAPLIMALELGLFERFGVAVRLQRELGWATVRDKIIFGELEAAHAVAGLALAATVGCGSIPCACVASLMLGSDGNAITLANPLFLAGVRDAASFRKYLSATPSRELVTLGIVSPFSSHNFLLRRWLRSGGINPDRDVRIVIVPPPQVCRNLRAGTLDGFCVGEPWNSLAVQTRVGWTVATSTELSRGHAEKNLVAREDFAAGRAEEYIALMAAILEACAWCDRPENLPELVSTLARAEYLGLPPSVLLPSLSGHYDFGHGRQEQIGEFITFHRGDTNDPTPDKVAWIARNAVDNGFHEFPRAGPDLCRRVFRRDLFRRAVARRDQVRALPAPGQPHPLPHPLATVPHETIRN